MTLPDDLKLGTTKKFRHTHVKYEGPNSYQSKDIVNIIVFADKQMDKQMDGQKGWPKTICPRSVNEAAKRKKKNQELYNKPYVAGTQ